MPINTEAWKRDLRAMIADLPVTIMFPFPNGKPITAHFQDVSAMLDIAEGGLPENLNAIIVALKDDFDGELPGDEDPIGVSIKGGGFKEYEVSKTAGANDMNEVSLMIYLGSGAN